MGETDEWTLNPRYKVNTFVRIAGMGWGREDSQEFSFHLGDSEKGTFWAGSWSRSRSFPGKDISIWKEPCTSLLLCQPLRHPLSSPWDIRLRVILVELHVHTLGRPWRTLSRLALVDENVWRWGPSTPSLPWWRVASLLPLFFPSLSEEDVLSPSKGSFSWGTPSQFWQREMTIELSRWRKQFQQLGKDGKVPCVFGKQWAIQMCWSCLV